MSEKENLHKEEIEKFSNYEKSWWDKSSYTAPLHRINPLRLNFIKSQLDIRDKTVIDIGCGGGILTEALARNAAIATGLDATKSAISAAVQHAKSENVHVNYIHSTIEAYKKNKPDVKFDFVTCMELLEHLPEPTKMVKECADLVEKDGLVFFSTINRNPKSFLFAIIGAEYLLQMIPRGTHNYKDLIKPSELDSWCRDANLEFVTSMGISYNPLLDKFYTTRDVSVNYMCAYRKTT